MEEAPQMQEGTVVDYTIDALREAIRSGRLAPGQRLIVADVTAMLSVSAGPVREAIRRLTGEGLIEIVPHKGASVRRITPGDLKEIYELRGAIEGLAARLAAERTPTFLDELTAVMEEMDELAGAEDVEGFLRNNTSFHELVYRMSGNVRVRTLASQLILPIYQLRLPQRMNLAALHLSHSEHREIVAALMKGDGEGAETAMRRHIAHAGQGLMEALAAEQPAERPRRARAARD